MNASPFSELARVAVRGFADREPLPDEAVQLPQHGTRTELLMLLLTEHGRLTTTELADLSGLDGKIVWGLLKSRKANGQVLHDGTAWEISDHWTPPEIKRAAELLRSRGWTVIAPGEVA